MLSVLSSAVPEREAEPVKGAWTLGAGAAGEVAPGGVLRQEGREGANFNAPQCSIGEREHDGLGAGNHADVGLPLLFQPLSQGGVASVDAVGDHPIGLQVGLTEPDQHLDGQFRLGAKGNLGRDTRFAATGAIIGPAGGQIQFAVDQGVATRSDPGEKDAELAVFHAACGTTVLASNTSGVLAALEETGLVYGKDGVLASQDLHSQLTHFIADAVLIPDSVVKRQLISTPSGN